MRMAIKENNRCDQELMDNLDSLMRRENDYSKAYKMMREFEIREENQANKEVRSIKPIKLQ
jgi:hypothetical protein